jgi:hypothetical protein
MPFAVECELPIALPIDRASPLATWGQCAAAIITGRKSMRSPTFAAFTGFALVALTACSDAATRVGAPDASNDSRIGTDGLAASYTSGSQSGGKYDDKDKGRKTKSDRDDDGDDDFGGSKGHGPMDKVTICHAAGRAGTTKYVEITVSRNASYAHIDEHGTPRAGHEEDYYAEEGRGCSGRGTIKKTLVEVKTSGPNGSMPNDPTWHPGETLTIPFGETRWLFYRIDYSLPSKGYGTITEDPAAVCATLGAGFNCSFNTGGKYSWSVRGSGSLIVQIDVTNKSVCGNRTFVNTAKLTPKHDTPISASASQPLALTCPTSIKLSKKLVGVMKEGATPGSMMPDPAWTPGSSIVVIPIGSTRWLDYDVTYTLPNGITGTITEDSHAVCATLGTFILQCSFNLAPTSSGVYSWSVTSGVDKKITVPIDLGGGGGGSCGDHIFTNTAKLTPSVGSPVTASTDITVRVVCPPPITITKTLVGVMKEGATPGSMMPDPAWTPGSSLVVIPIGSTRWMDFAVSYTLPAGVTGTITEDSHAVCGTLGTFILQCSFNLAPTSTGVYSWSVVSGGNPVIVPIDLGGGGGGSCGDHIFTNTAKLTPSVGSAVSASKDITVRVVCP